MDRFSLSLCFRHASRTSATALAISLAFATPSVNAEELGPYIGAGFVQTQFEHDWSFGPNTTITHVDDDDQGYRIIGGWRMLRWLAVEASYADLGGAIGRTQVVCAAAVGFPCPSRLSADVKTSQLSALALWPLGQFDLFAKAGVNRWDATARIADDTTTIARIRDHDHDPVYGIGAQYLYEHLVLRLEFEHLEIGASEADAFSLAAIYRF